MSLAPGIRIGPYEVVSALGAGGMGEVNRARDTTLGRDVALKTLPDAVAHDPEYVRPFPGPGASTRVSIAGGSQPRWRQDGSELFCLAPDSRLMTVPSRLPSSGSGITLGSPVSLFAAAVTSTVQGGVSFEYDVSRDGQRFLVNTLVE